MGEKSLFINSLGRTARLLFTIGKYNGVIMQEAVDAAAKTTVGCGSDTVGTEDDVSLSDADAPRRARPAGGVAFAENGV